jgi:hypothetical protein
VDWVEVHEEKGGFPQGGSASSVRSVFVVRKMESWPGRPRPHTGLRREKAGQA